VAEYSTAVYRIYTTSHSDLLIALWLHGLQWREWMKTMAVWLSFLEAIRENYCHMAIHKGV